MEMKKRHDEPKKDWRKLHAAYKENWYTTRPPDKPRPQQLLEYIISNCVTSKTPYEYDLDNPYDRKLHKLITTKVRPMKEMLADNDAKIEAEREAKKAPYKGTSDDSDTESVMSELTNQSLIDFFDSYKPPA